MTITAIQARLTQIRKDSDAIFATRAREEYGASFSEIFTYKKSGVCYVKTKVSGIAEQYRMLKGIDNIYEVDENDDDDM